VSISAKSTPSTVLDLELLLKGLETVPGQKRIEDYKATVEAIGRREEVIPLLRSILNSPATLAEVAARSYLHVNKFDKIVLVGNSEFQAYRLTLHLWRPPYSQDALKQELIHDHRFNFWSTILTGTLSSEVFQQRHSALRQNGSLRTYRQYRYIPEAARATEFREFYKYRGNVNLLSTGIQHRGTGETYYLDAPTIHRIILPQRNITCSLVLRGPRLRSYSCVFNTTYPSRDTFQKNKMFSESDLAYRLSQLLLALGTEGK
jgi:hypothetical protein